MEDTNCITEGIRKKNSWERTSVSPQIATVSWNLFRAQLHLAGYTIRLGIVQVFYTMHYTFMGTPGWAMTICAHLNTSWQRRECYSHHPGQTATWATITCFVTFSQQYTSMFSTSSHSGNVVAQHRNGYIATGDCKSSVINLAVLLSAITCCSIFPAMGVQP